MSATVRTAKLYWAVFFAALLIPFLLTVIFIFRMPKYSDIRSAVELATTFDQNQQKPIDQPERVARTILDVYVPLAARENNARVLPTTSLHAFSSGDAILLAQRVRAGQEASALAAQKKLQSDVLEQQTELTKLFRDALKLKIQFADQALQSIDSETKLINARADAFDDMQRRQRSHSDADKDGALLIGDIQFGRASIDRSLIDTYRRREGQIRDKALAQLQLNATSDAKIIMEPSVFAVAASPRRSLFLIAAAVGSFLFAIIVVFLFDRFRYRGNA